jgi:hypothetical protein
MYAACCIAHAEYRSGASSRLRSFITNLKLSSSSTSIEKVGYSAYVTGEVIFDNAVTDWPSVPHIEPQDATGVF